MTEIPSRDDERTRCECWTRVMGYFRPVAAWNPGKQAEHRERRRFRLPSSAEGALSSAGRRRPVEPIAPAAMPAERRDGLPP
jgi:hypothetical protein